MKIVFLTQYFPPEVGAPQNRLYELASFLRKKGVDVSVITGMPNYPEMIIDERYRGKLYLKEMLPNGIIIHRVWLFVTRKKGIIPRLLNYFSFVITSALAGLLKIKNCDYLFCESPPLFLGLSAFFLSRLKKVKLIFNVSDLWPESAEKLGIINNKSILGITTRLEEFIYRKSFLITGQTKGIVNNISARTTNGTVLWLPNGVNLSDINCKSGKRDFFRKELGLSEDDIIAFYGGIIGHAQGLDVILRAASRLKDLGNLKFIIMGSGPEKERLLALKNELMLENVFFADTQKKDTMPAVLNSIDMSIIPLKRIDLFKGAIPSKIFEACAYKKPLLLGVEGEAYDSFIKDGKCGLHFTPENDEELAQRATELYKSEELRNSLGKNGHDYVIKYFNREKISEDFYSCLDIKNN